MIRFMLFSTTAILSIVFCESALACPSGQIEDATTGHCIKTAESCDGKCTWYFDTTTHDLRFEKNENVPDGEDVIIPYNLYRGGITGWGSSDWDRTITNVTIGEGITGAEKWALATYGSYTTGTSTSTLTLPSTFKLTTDLTVSDASFWNVTFGTIDASALKDTYLYLPVNVNQNIILSPGSNVTINHDSSYSGTGKVNIVCKGEKSECEDMLKLGSYEKVLWNQNHPGENQVSSSYYSGPDGNGHYEEWSDDGKTVYEDSSKSKILSNYDFSGNQTGSYNYNANGILISANTYDSEGNITGTYKYDSGGNLISAYRDGKSIYQRKIYTIPEAEAATKEGNVNKLTITW